MCSGKQRFADENAAKQAIWHVRQKNQDAGWLTPYRCKFCNGYHFGHPPRRIRQSLAATR
jgi:hypothetical protein